MKVLSLKLPNRLASSLEREARQRGRTKSDLVRDALDAYLERKPNTRPRGASAHKPAGASVTGRKKAANSLRRRVSALDLAGDLAGCLDGPEDLATNPVHMEGFGK